MESTEISPSRNTVAQITDIPIPFWRLSLTAFICGFAIMVLEVLGSRVVGPYFGVGLFVWTSLIAVTMIALAAGYLVGGVVADRYGTPGPMYALIAMAGFFCWALPLIRTTVLKICMPLGVRGGAFTSSLLLFGPPLFLLGCVSPYLIRLAAKKLESVGKTVGALYGLSTIGSIVGTVAAGFFFIATMDVNTIFLVTGAVLAALSMLHFLLGRKYRFGAGPALVIVLCAGAFVATDGGAVERILPGGTHVKLIGKKDGYYGSIRVLDFSFGQNLMREMTIDGLIQGGVDMRSGLPVYEYLYFMEFLPTGIRPGGKRCLVLGLGAGVLPMWYECNGITTDVVEIDPNVVDLARKYFGFSISGDLFLEDARYFLKSSDRTYDYLIVDVYNGDSTPTHLIGLEAFRQAKERMNRGGVLAINLHGALGDDGFVPASVVRTLKQVFDNVDLYPAFDPQKRAHGNIAIVAYDGARQPPDDAWLTGFSIHPSARAAVTGFSTRGYEYPSSVESITLTDDFNPMDIREGRMREDIRRGIMAEAHSDLLL